MLRFIAPNMMAAAESLWQARMLSNPEGILRDNWFTEDAALQKERQSVWREDE